MAQALSNAQVAILGDPILVKKLAFCNKILPPSELTVVAQPDLYSLLGN
jgi:hypothetical protein